MSDTPRERLAPALRRTWLFGAGADRAAHEAMAQSGADVLIQDLEDFTPPALRHEARALAPALYRRWREAGALVCVRINSLDADGYLDLQDVMPGRPDIVAYPKSATALHMRALDVSLTTLERALGIADGTTEILPVCETALGVVNVREIAAASQEQSSGIQQIARGVADGRPIGAGLDEALGEAAADEVGQRLAGLGLRYEHLVDRGPVPFRPGQVELRRQRRLVGVIAADIAAAPRGGLDHHLRAVHMAGDHVAARIGQRIGGLGLLHRQRARRGNRVSSRS